MKTRALIALTLIALFATTLRAADDATLAAVRAADDQRVAATLAPDRDKLNAIFSDELHYAHSTGGVDTKTSYIESMVAGKLSYLSYEYQEKNFTLAAPGVALMTGKVKVKTASSKGESESVLGFLAVWREEKGQWRFLAWQSCKMPAPAPTAAK